jgi:hypothetical protein
MPSKQPGRGSWDPGVLNQEDLTDYACSSSHRCRQMLTLLPTEVYIAADRGLHCCRQRFTLLPTEVYIAADRGLHCCRQRFTLLPTDAYIAANRGLHCCQQPLTLLLASLVDGDELSIKPLLAPLCPRCIGSRCKHNSVSIYGWARPLSHPGPR